MEDQRRKLEETQALLQSNQQMIQWLNTQVTEAQLGKFSPAATRYSFRPTLATGSTAVPLPAGPPGEPGKEDEAGVSRPASAVPAPISIPSTSGPYVPGKYSSYRGTTTGGAAPAPTPSSFMPAKPTTPPHPSS